MLNQYRIKFMGTPIAGITAENKIVAFNKWFEETFPKRPNEFTLVFRDGVCQTMDRIDIFPLGIGIVEIVPV